MPSDKVAHYRQTGKSLLLTPAQYKTQYEWLKEVDSLALTNSQLHLYATYKKYFSKKRVGFPKYKKYKSKKKSRRKYTTNNKHGAA